MPLPFQSQDAVPRRLDAMAAEDIEVDRGLRPRRDQDLDRGRGRTERRFTQQQRGWAEIDGKTSHHRTVVDVAAVAEQLDVRPHRQRVSVEPVGLCRRGRRRSSRPVPPRSPTCTTSGSRTRATAAPSTLSAKRKRSSSTLSPGPPLHGLSAISTRTSGPLTGMSTSCSLSRSGSARPRARSWRPRPGTRRAATTPPWPARLPAPRPDPGRHPW